MTIAIDYDNTYTRDPELWREFVRLCKSKGHACLIVTGRSDEGFLALEVRTTVKDLMPVVFAGKEWKRDATKARGWSVDVWIDDHPEYVGKQFLWGGNKMDEKNATRAHDDDPNAAKYGQASYELRVISWKNPRISSDPEIYRTCSYCGSVDVETMLIAMSLTGTTYSGSDWKYGWPHKFYVDIPCAPYDRGVGGRSSGENSVEHAKRMSIMRHHKFYSIHLRDATPGQLTAWNEKVSPLLGVKFALDGQKLSYLTPCGGWQTWGVVNGPLMEGAPPVPQWFLDKEFTKE